MRRSSHASYAKDTGKPEKVMTAPGRLQSVALRVVDEVEDALEERAVEAAVGLRAIDGGPERPDDRLRGPVEVDLVLELHEVGEAPPEAADRRILEGAQHVLG